MVMIHDVLSPVIEHNVVSTPNIQYMPSPEPGTLTAFALCQCTCIYVSVWNYLIVENFEIYMLSFQQYNAIH